MAYPRNAASPPPVAIGAVVQISDGAVQTTGVTVYHRTSSTTESSGGGTTNVGATTGTIYYTPTQAETNYESFELVAFKSGCIPASVTVVTTASATAGKVDVGAFGGTAVTGRDIGASVLLAADQAVNCTKVNGTAQTAGDLAALITTVDGIVDTIVARVVGTIAAGTHNPQSGDAYARLGAPAGASHAADVAAVKSDTAAIKTKTDNLPTDPADESLIEAAITSATASLATAANLATVAGYLDTEIAAILADTDELQKAITDGGRTDLLIDAIKAKTDAMPSAATISTQVASDLASAHGAGAWTTATGFSTHSAADVVTALGAGSTLTDIPWNASWDAEVQSECDDAITANTLIKRIAVTGIGDVTGAGTGTEVFIYGGVTATVTVYGNGNRSLSWS